MVRIAMVLDSAKKQKKLFKYSCGEMYEHHLSSRSRSTFDTRWLWQVLFVYDFG
jgi:hypothetical protein